MTRLIAIFFMLLLASGCSDSNDGGPDVTEAHPDNFIIAHPEPARDDPDRCRSCHGANFEGAVGVIGCTACHPFGLNPQAGGFFSVHPLSWGTTEAAIIDNHGTFPLDFNWTTCANGACHGTTLRGGTAGPSCFTCHPQGPPAPSALSVDHPMPFALPQQHGPEARENLFACFNCHGRPPSTFDGGYVSDPAIRGQLSGNCSICHPEAQAHPARWLGENDPDPTVYRSTHTELNRELNRDDIEKGCSLCHALSPGSASTVPSAPSCTLCHPAGF